jgi:hypothetical protein
MKEDQPVQPTDANAIASYTVDTIRGWTIYLAMFCLPEREMTQAQAETRVTNARRIAAALVGQFPHLANRTPGAS